MSLSQKHSGKVLVPWFNISEWHVVYGLIYSEAAPDWPRALHILKIWKHRTPLLSAGVEGTLIILEALLIQTNLLSSYEISHIFSTSLIRFLNLCAANSDRQGTFYKAAMKNELPRWLVNIRHDIAHSHKIPSQSMLKLSLEFCLDWLKGKYWKVQFDNMRDYVVGNADGGTIVEDALFVYRYLDGTESKKKQKEVRRCVDRFIQNSADTASSDVIMENVNEALCEAIKNNKDESCDKICAVLVDGLAILSTKCEVDASDNNKIPDRFINKWNDLINIIYDAGIMPDFLSRLSQFTCNAKYDMAHRQIASLWIKEIYTGLIYEESGLKVDSGVRFQNLNDSLKNKKILDQVLDAPSPFTLDFLQEVLQYNNAPEKFIEEAVSLVSALNTLDGCTSERIFTMDDMEVEETVFEDSVVIDEPRRETSSRWILIEDTSAYINVPLGILPHQDRNTNPMFAV